MLYHGAKQEVMGATVKAGTIAASVQTLFKAMDSGVPVDIERRNNDLVQQIWKAGYAPHRQQDAAELLATVFASFDEAVGTTKLMPTFTAQHQRRTQCGECGHITQNGPPEPVRRAFIAAV
jgi:hypothetical protein